VDKGRIELDVIRAIKGKGFSKGSREVVRARRRGRVESANRGGDHWGPNSESLKRGVES